MLYSGLMHKRATYFWFVFLVPDLWPPNILKVTVCLLDDGYMIATQADMDIWIHYTLDGYGKD